MTMDQLFFNLPILSQMSGRGKSGIDFVSNPLKFHTIASFMSYGLIQTTCIRWR